MAFKPGNNGGSGGRPRGHHNRTLTLIDLLVRLELANPTLNFVELATLADIKPGRYLWLRKLAAYSRVKQSYTTGIISNLDEVVQKKLNLTQTTLDFAVPMAMQALVQQALSSKDERVKNKAANDILDRHGHFAKVSRVGAPTEEQGGVATDADQEVADKLAEALNSGKVVPIAGT